MDFWAIRAAQVKFPTLDAAFLILRQAAGDFVATEVTPTHLSRTRLAVTRSQSRQSVGICRVSLDSCEIRHVPHAGRARYNTGADAACTAGARPATIVSPQQKIVR